MAEKFVARTPQPGTWVHWFQRGDTSLDPVPALVQAVNQRGGGMVHLSLARSTHVTWDHINSWVRHVDDPFLDDKPELKAMYGAWREIPAETIEQQLAREAKREKAK